jgi:Protein of unknown function (DUF3634)
MGRAGMKSKLAPGPYRFRFWRASRRPVARHIPTKQHMAYLPVFIGLLLFALILAWQVPARGRVFVIRVRNGVPVVTRGKITQGFLAEVADVVRRNGIRRGSIFGLSRRGGSINLGFSRTIPANCRQSLRNVWSMHAR